MFSSTSWLRLKKAIIHFETTLDKKHILGQKIY